MGLHVVVGEGVVDCSTFSCLNCGFSGILIDIQ